VAYPCHHVATFCQIGKFCCHNCGIQCQKGGISMPPYINFCHLLANLFHFLATKFPPFKFICQLGNFACHRVAFDAKKWHINATLLLFLPPRGKFVPHFATFLNGGKSFSGPFRPAGPLRLVTSRKGLSLYCLS